MKTLDALDAGAAFNSDGNQRHAFRPAPPSARKSRNALQLRCDFALV